MPPKKIVVVEDGVRQTLEFAAPLIKVGRAVDNHVQLRSAHSSRHHCQIEVQGEDAWVVDLDSANGTLWNGERIVRSPLARGDVLAIGEARIEWLGEARGSADDALRTIQAEDAAERDEVVVFARIARALLEENELDPLLRLIVDSAVLLVGGERGFLLLFDTDAAPKEDLGRIRVRVARSFDRTDIPLPSSRLSMGIARQAVRERQAVLSVDAGRDERFEGMASVEGLKLRSVVCLPIDLDGKIAGVLYVDNRLQEGVFGEEDQRRLGLLADLAASAIRNARWVAELREKNERLIGSSQKIQRLNEELGRKVRDQGSELAVVRAELGRERGRYDYSQIVGSSDAMRKVFAELDRTVEAELPVLIQGESGTGKELIARAIHFNGSRKAKPFVAENCAALPDTLLESELFGHARGAFTGADRAKKGLIEQATGGTLFLDEIGDMSSAMQKNLLRVLQEGELRPLGSSQRVQVDVRLVAASNRDLAEMVKRGEFREDLYYRINVLTLKLPPLRERRDDVPLLAEALLNRAARDSGRPAPALSHEVLAQLAEYDWPGNVRELENEARRLILAAVDVVRLEHLSEPIRQAGAASTLTTASLALVGSLPEAVASFERKALRDALTQNEGNKSRAAKDLGISRFALQRKLDKYEIDEEAARNPGSSGR
ncbi:MAG: sigma 54-interacting transcriptional regulator [Planctomycetota bacterium]